MYIQIDNAGFVNKGAALMILSIMDYLRSKIPGVKFVMGNGWSPDKTAERRAGLYQIAEFENVSSDCFSKEELERYGLVKRQFIDVILDAGGFQYGDCWLQFYSNQSNETLKTYYSEYKKNNVKIILLPQAFGSFEEELARERMKIVFDFADLIYAREKISLDYLTDLLGESQKIQMSPDFTTLFEPYMSSELIKKVEGAVCLIPNCKMIEKCSAEIGSVYLSFLEKIVQFFIEKGEKVLLLNHEGKEDLKIIKDLKSRFNENESIIIQDIGYAPAIKATIGQCKLLISSRFHGLISGIAQGVPSFCTSWNHKYQELLKDYGLENNLLDPSSLDDALDKMNSCLSHPQEYIASPDLIQKNKNQSVEMWSEVLDSILVATC